ncbi:polysaccharide lyase family 7 protein [Pseudomonas sp. DTU_2021_1001937_2_SI_NGA_ILE_001]|uniref:polysaccharide lyase family 7 protein n=1 Tax=Pseudomonas sp. DTU_2021_1001937_2_SI_NGA_ILE_001 TaxID=3077589 RepID=UPI0025F0479B|nr:polysaccharide lyase family 7 protein [Pseudomonas sp. DTU_2021_1001937_2_SI_NGA_ILE_001]WNW11090.1 polysaccharide lyase family 7 protein [Pseudomonas sp. DTU_2021_1001937_2_SI_NGA_ILE_001]
MIDLATWNLSIPVGVPAQTIATAQLMRGYQDGYFRSGNTLFFWAPVTGSTTDNAKFPRTELRETTADGRAFNWNYTSADNFLRAALMVNQVPSSGKIVIGQIHTYQSNEPLLKVEYQYKDKLKTGNIVAKLRRSPQSEIEVITIAEGVPLNQRFSYSIHLTPAGNLTVNAYENVWNVRLDPTWSTKLLYFKAGVYTQDNTGYATEGGAATFYQLSIAHDKKG